jgi:hypothetical protein
MYSAFDGIDPAAPLYEAVQRGKASFVPETNAPYERSHQGSKPKLFLSKLFIVRLESIFELLLQQG